MPEYRCNKCNKIFTQKSNYLTHINKKKDCLKKKIFSCDICNKHFYHKSSVSRHKKKCKKIYLENTNNSENTINNTTTNTINNTTNNTINNTTNITLNNINLNNNNGSINSLNNIFVLPYNGKDKIQLSDESYLKILNSGFKCIPKLIEASHFNKKSSEYHNIYIPNIKEKYVLIYTGIEWEIRNSDEILDEIVNYKIEELEEKFDEIMEQLPIKVRTKFTKFLNKKEEDDMINTIKENLRILLYNKRHIPVNTRKKIKEVNQKNYKKLTEKQKDEQIGNIINILQDIITDNAISKKSKIAQFDSILYNYKKYNS